MGQGKAMRVVSLVPSLTETLLEAGAEVVGRTRYCVEPQQLVKHIAIVGGTKDLDWKKIIALKADLLVVDREENLPWMKEKSPIPVHVFHATSVKSLAGEFHKLAKVFVGTSAESSLEEESRRWQAVSEAKNRDWDWHQIPSEIKREGPDRKWEKVLYLIWKKPWMSVSKETFICSVFEKLGAQNYWPNFEDKYPKIDLADFSSETTLLLLSSEPYPFDQKWLEFSDLPHTRVLVNGAELSWFGTRTLRFLEACLGLKK